VLPWNLVWGVLGGGGVVRRRRVESSVVRSVGYEKGEGVLEVEFVGGRVYRYFVVPESVYLGLVGAESVGRYFNESIRDRYPMREVG
jgi:hypothetical protein